MGPFQLAALAVASVGLAQASLSANITVPDGFKISVFASGMDHPRSLAKSPAGTIFVGSKKEAALSSVYAFTGIDKDTGKATHKYVVAANLTSPNGIDFYNKDLYIALNDRILIMKNVEDNLAKPNAPTTFITLNDPSTIIPDPMWHGNRFLRISADGKMYVSIGAPCNTPADPATPGNSTCDCLLQQQPDVCDAWPGCVSCRNGTAPGPQQNIGEIWVLDLLKEKPTFETFAKGVRNSVGFDFNPQTKDLWFTDNGRDDWNPDHNNRPPDELNHASAAGMHFGYPFCYGKNESDTQFNHRGCENSGYTGAAFELGAHVAPLGMRFYSSDVFPPKYHNGVFIAEHGSWDREPPSGYRLTFVTLSADGNTATAYEPFVTGWLDKNGDGHQGRPADVLVMDDGSLLMSNEQTGELYRIEFAGSNTTSEVEKHIMVALAVIWGAFIFFALVYVYKENKSAGIQESYENF